MLLNPLSDLMGKIFESQSLPSEMGRVIMADRPDLADVQCNGALQGAKLAGKPPRAIAEAIVAELQAKHADLFTDISIAGPGFINMKLHADYLGRLLNGQKQADKFGVDGEKDKTILIEFCSPNLGKALHIGHLRNVMIGDAVRRLVQYSGYKVISDNHLGDWGLPMGQILSETKRRYPDLPYFDESYQGDYPAESPVNFEELCVIYPAASQRSKDDPEELMRAQLMTAELQGGHKGYRALWQHFMAMSVADMNEKLNDFGVSPFDTYYGESYMDQFIPYIMDDIQGKGLLDDVDGAKGIHVAEETDKFDIPPLIVVKRMGGVTYAATDIATFYQRQKDFNPDICIILTDFRQELHFERVYRASRRAGYADHMQFVHLMYGTINSEDGKPYKTRSGGVPGFSDFTDMVTGKAVERLQEIGLHEKLSNEDFNETAKQIGHAAVKFGDLINYRRSDYIFDLDKFVSFEGKTGPYIQYAIVRAKALLAKAASQGMEAGNIVIDEPHREMALMLLQFPNVIDAAVADYAPNVLADYLFRLAQSVNKFYQNVPVLIEPDATRRGSALALMELSAEILTTGLGLLGINVPKQM